MKKILFFILLLAAFFVPTSVKAADNNLIGTPKIADYKGMKKISFQSNCTNYTKNGGDGTGTQNFQNIYYNESGSGTRNTIWFQHGDGGCSFPNGRKKCESDYFDAGSILTHPNNGKNLIMFCPEMNPSGGDACPKTWSTKYESFFDCLYNDFIAALKQATSDNIKASKDTIIASHSQGGPATSKITLNIDNHPKIKVTKIIRFDSCYSDQCLNEANLPVEKRGPLITYASTLPVVCPINPKTGKPDFCNSVANQAATVAKEIYKKPNVESYTVPNTAHGGVPTACKTSFLDANHNCGNKAILAGGTTTNIAGSGGTAVSSFVAPGGDVLAGLATFDEIQLILMKPKLQVRLPGVNFSDIKEVDDNGTKFLFIPFLGEYLAAGYKYAIVIAGIFATAMILNAGFTLLMAAGSSEKVNYAKKRIGEALIGLLLAVGSYVFLYTINPELVNFRNLRVMAIRGEQMPGAIEETADVPPEGTPGTGPGSSAFVKPTAANEVNEKYFAKTDINGKSTDGWAVWNSLGESDKQSILPFLVSGDGDCPVGKGAKPDIKRNNGQTVHPAIVQFVKQAESIANQYGFELSITSGIRSPQKQAQLWNTGLVGRYTQKIAKWSTNEGFIAKPGCNAPHSTGGAIDLSMFQKDGKQVVSAGKTAKATKDTAKYQSIFFTQEPYFLILEEIMKKAGFVRFCDEYWHFEHKIDSNLPIRANKFDGQANTRCVRTYDNWHVDIPSDVKAKINSLVAGGNLF